MNLSIIDKKCTLDYLNNLIPKQKKMLDGLVDGGVMDIDSQIETIEYTLQFIEKGSETYDYDSILKVLNTWVENGKGHIRLDMFQKELKESFVV